VQVARPLDAGGCYHYYISMKSILIRDVEPDILEKIKRLARSHRRSLQGEIHAILDRAARLAPEETRERFELVTVNTGGTSRWNREEIYGDQGR